MLLLGAVYLLNNYFNGKTEVNYKKYLIIVKENKFYRNLVIQQLIFIWRSLFQVQHIKEKEFIEMDYI